MAYSFLPYLLLALVTTGAVADIPEQNSDCAVADYTTLLSVKSSQLNSRDGDLDAEPRNGMTPMADDRTAIPGVIFVKMIKVAGELFSSTLAQYALKRGWRALQHKDCNENVNPMGQATCECSQHYIGPDDAPSAPNDGRLYEALYTHMHYNPSLLKKYMVPGAVRLVILRHPLSVLRSTHAMAAYQAVNEKHIHNDFCQDLALDGDAWRAKCPRLHTGLDSLLDYLDPDANAQLRRLFEEQPADLHERAKGIVDKAELLLNDFVIGLQEDYDASMLLFQDALRWSREDSLYVDHDVNSHIQSHKSGASKKALDSWGIGTPRGEEIVKRLRQGPYFYHELLYKKGVEIHNKQLNDALGSRQQVDSAVATYRAQKSKFTTCMHHATKGPAGRQVNVCKRGGLELYTKARPHCAKIAVDADHV